MAKKIEIKKKVSAGNTKSAAFVLPELSGNGWLFLKDFRMQAIVIVLVGVLFYGNTVKNQYCLDDDIIMKQNMYVQKGISGIGEIFSNDAYKSYYQSMGVEQQLEGGRYRPLSVVTFAIEQSIFGECYGDRATEVRDSLFALQRQGVTDATTNRLITEQNELNRKIKITNNDLAPWRHGFQVFWFLLSMIILLWFLRDYIFRSNTDIAFLSVLLFTIHPIHTEVVANIKSRDEIFSLLFITLTFIYFFRYDLSRRGKDMLLGLGSFLLALLSKEYAVVLVVLLPASIMIIHKRKLRDVLVQTLPYLGVLVLYAFIHIGVIGDTPPIDKSKQDPLKDPYLYASSEQKLASKINRLDDYLWLCLLPYPLVSDYSYQHFPYSKLSDPMMWLSLLVNIGLIILALRLWMKRHVLAFPMLIYLFFFALICNMFFDIGATMGERLIYHSSLGVCMVVAWLLVAGVEKIKDKVSPKIFLPAIVLLITIPAWIITVQRNAQWKNDFTLFTHDVITHPNSALTNGNAGARYMDYGLECLGRDTIIGKDTILKYGRDTVKVHRFADTATTFLLRATQIHPKYVNGFLNLGLCYYYKEQYELAGEAWGNAYRYFPSNTNLLNYENMLMQQSNNYAAKKEYATSARFLRCAITANPADAKAWSDYGGASFMSKDFKTAIDAFNESYNILAQQIVDQESHLNKQGYDNNAINKIVSQLKSQQEGIRNGLGAATYNQKFVSAWQRDTMNVDSTIQLAKMYTGTVDFWPESRRLLNHALEIRPNDPKALNLLDSLGTLEKKAKLPSKK